jgi:hypothetical protein
MLNKDNQRELAYIVTIDEIKPIPNYDRVEHARVGGWWVIVKKNQFKVGEPAIYIEVDSKVPEKEPFLFLEAKKYRVKTQKMCKVISQGLLMHPSDFGWFSMQNKTDLQWDMHDEKGKVLEVGDFVTEKLGITYYEPEDNKRKANSVDKYKKMAQRRPDIFKKPWARWMMKRDWGKKVMFLFFGRKKDKKGAWPSWIKKTDEERCQNMPWLFPGGDERFTVTEKIDGTSTTFAIKGWGRKQEFYVCSRNVVQDTPERENYYDGNVYWEMAEKYNVKEALASFMDPGIEYIILQGETYGEGIQKRDYSMKGHDFAAFNLIVKEENCEPIRFDWYEMKRLLDVVKIPVVPLVDGDFKIPETCDELLEIAEGNSAIDGKMREGIVIRSKDGQRSFKAVSNPFLLKYHS